MFLNNIHGRPPATTKHERTRNLSWKFSKINAICADLDTWEIPQNYYNLIVKYIKGLSPVECSYLNPILKEPQRVKIHPIVISIF